MNDSVRSDAVLVIADEKDQELVDVLFEGGLTAVIRRPSVSTIARIHPGEYLAVLVLDEGQDRDVLEWVLNIRDRDEAVPVLVLGAGEPLVCPSLLERLHVHWLDRSMAPEALARHVLRVVEGKAQSETELSEAASPETGRRSGR